MIDTESEPGAWEREIAMRPKTQEAGGRVMTDRHGKFSALEREELRNEQLEAERDALRAEVTRLKVDKELLNREYEAVRERVAALSDESRTLFVAIMELGNKEGE